MADPIVVADVEDPRLDDFRDLTVADRRPDRPGGRGLVIAEGVPVVQRLLASPYPLLAVMGVPGRIRQLGTDLVDVRAPVYEVAAAVMAAVVGFHLNRGVLAVAGRPVPPPVPALLATSRRLVILEGLNDPENLGSIFRNAAALGVDAVLLGDRCADPLYRRSVRVSMGTVLQVPFARLAPWPDALADVRAAGFTVIGLTPRADAVSLRQLDPSALPRTALLLGAEGPGLTEAALSAVDCPVRIPMPAHVDSLNVATAAAIACHHLSGLS